MKTLLVAIVISASAAQLWAQDQIVNETTLPSSEVSSQLIDNSFATPLVPTPGSDFQPSFVSSSLTIQSVPEPSTFALGSLALGLIAFARNKSARIERIKK
jgi:hypothetical protein